ncbi:hypothetical protein GCM10007918_27060 [Piscinibacter gummiphilus]|nr:hypothetical protein GCM10007918_27060 [Piscinibacter gummiphilus]
MARRVAVPGVRRPRQAGPHLTPNAFWVDLRKVDFSPGAGHVKVLRLGEHQRNVFAGETSGRFEVSKPFAFLGLPAK